MVMKVVKQEGASDGRWKGKGRHLRKRRGEGVAGDMKRCDRRGKGLRIEERK